MTYSSKHEMAVFGISDQGYTPPPPPPSLKGSHLWKIRIRLLGWWVSGSLGCHITSSFLYGKQGPKNQVQLSTRALNE